MIQSFNGKCPRWGKDCYIAENATLIGDVVLGDHVSIWPNVVLRADINSIIIGKGSNVQDGSVIHGDPSKETRIGSGVTIGHMVHIHGAVIEDNVIVGSTSVILDGAHVHTETIIGAGSLVVPRQIVESGVLMTGRPATVKRLLTQEDKAHIRVNAQDYVEMSAQYLKEASSR